MSDLTYCTFFCCNSNAHRCHFVLLRRTRNEIEGNLSGITMDGIEKNENQILIHREPESLIFYSRHIHEKDIENLRKRGKLILIQKWFEEITGTGILVFYNK